MLHDATAAGRTAPARPPAVDKNDKERTESRLLSPLMSNGIAPGGPPALTRPSASVGSFLAGPPPARGSAVVARLGARRIGTAERCTWMRSVWLLAHGPRRRTMTHDTAPRSLITKVGAAPLIFACSEAVTRRSYVLLSQFRASAFLPRPATVPACVSLGSTQDRRTSIIIVLCLLPPMFCHASSLSRHYSALLLMLFMCCMYVLLPPDVLRRSPPPLLIAC